MLTIIWWGGGAQLTLVCSKERRPWRFLSSCRMTALLSCLPLGESFWPFIKIPRPSHCLPSGCCHWRTNPGPLRRTDFWNLWPRHLFFVSWSLQCINAKLREVIFLETIYTCKEYCGSVILDKRRVCCNFLLVSGTTGTSHTHLSCGHCTQTCHEQVSIMMPRPGSTHCFRLQSWTPHTKQQDRNIAPPVSRQAA